LADQFTKTKPKDEIIYKNFGNYAFSKDLWKLKTIEAKNNMELQNLSTNRALITRHPEWGMHVLQEVQRNQAIDMDKTKI
ncbi:hypothetical protein AVEN_271301-1, partial [Araneus ventricosus]